VARADAERIPGGDAVQLDKTREALQALGVEVEVRKADDLERPPPSDVAHVFNLQTTTASSRAFDALEAAAIPTVLSSIYWDMYPHWFDLALGARARWRWLERGLGRARARRVYTTWQRAKRPLRAEWRTQRRLLQRAVRVLPNSRSEAALLAEFFRLDGDLRRKVSVVPNGVDPALFAPPVAPCRAFTERHGIRDFVLQVSALSPVKNQLGLLDALHDLPVPLVFVGQPAPARPDYAEECKARAARRGNVVFLDALPHDRLPGLYALAAVHVLPSWRETPGLASLEAAAAGCRVVTTCIGSARDYFGDAAWYCRPDDPSSIRAAVEAALRAPPSTHLRDRVLSTFTWRHAAEATLEAYRAALAERAR
jgi:glycosyltransferase involved in cell wall biosynthesis